MRGLLRPSRARRIAKWTGLVVCVGILAMWAVSTKVEVYRAGTPLSMQSLYGFVSIHVADYRTSLPIEWGLDASWPWEPGRHLLDLPRVWRESPRRLVIELPYWLPFILAAIPTAILWHRDRPAKPGFCRQCGYDLRASKNTCPECGTAVA